MMIAAAAITAYLIGSISFAVLVSGALKLPDPRTYGSKNPGATNVLRTGKKIAAVLTLLGDAAKGWFAVFVAARFLGGDAVVVSTAAVAVILGHIFPLFYRFQGGKGVATALGVLLALNTWLAAGTASTWIIIAVFFRISSLAALIAAVSAPVFCYLLYGASAYTTAVGIIAALLIWRHKSNIRNLLDGTEGRLGSKPAAPTAE